MLHSFFPTLIFSVHFWWNLLWCKKRNVEIQLYFFQIVTNHTDDSRRLVKPSTTHPHYSLLTQSYSVFLFWIPIYIWICFVLWSLYLMVKLWTVIAEALCDSFISGRRIFCPSIQLFLPSITCLFFQMLSCPFKFRKIL